MVLQEPLPANVSEANRELNSQEYLAEKTRLASFPYHIQIGADNRCNLRCGFCLAAAYRERGWTHIQDRRLEKNPVELFERLTPYMKYWTYLSLTGPGESLVNPELERILDLVRENTDCVILITTNGVLLNPRLADLFIRERVDEVSISIESLKKELYESLRVNARFESVMKAIDALNQAKRQHGTEFPRLNLTPNFSRRNIEELPDFIRFAHDNGVSAVQATPTQVYRRSWVKDSLLHFPGLTRRTARAAELLADQLGVKFVNELRMVYTNRGRGLLGFLKKREPVDFPTDPSLCLKPWTSIYVEPDGRVHPCCYRSPVYGSLYEKSLEELWNGPEAQNLRAAMKGKEPPSSCRACYEFNRDDPSIMIQLDFEYEE